MKQLTLSERFLEQADKHASRVAIIDNDISYSYTETSKAVLVLAHHLLQTQQVQPNDIVGVAMANSYELIVSCLAINLVGATWMPLSDDLPEAVQQEMIRESDAKVVWRNAFPVDVTDPQLSLSTEAVSQLRQYSHENVMVEHRMFLVYSSGSTGKPKGILQRQKEMLNAFDWRFDIYPNNASTNMGACVFFIWECFRPLLCGGTVTVIPKLILLDGVKLTAFINKHNITEILFTPSACRIWLNALTQKTSFTALQCVFLCGEVVNKELCEQLVDRVDQHVQLLNLYSISEAPELAISDIRVTEAAYFETTNFIALALSKEKSELIVAGPTVSTEGYLNRPDVNERRFFKHTSGYTAFRTGDGVKVNLDMDGFKEGLTFELQQAIDQHPSEYKLFVETVQHISSISVIGRIDSMKKVRGFSVQCDELENVIQDEFKATNVFIKYIDQLYDQQQKKTVESELHCYIQGSDTMDISNWYARLSRKVPAYALPARVFFVDDNEKSLDQVSGKKNRDPAEMRIIQLAERPVPADPVMRVWSELLGFVPNETDDFFVSGGNSLLAVNLLTKLQDFYTNDDTYKDDAQRIQAINISDVFANPTPIALRELFEKGNDDSLTVHQYNVMQQDVLDLCSTIEKTFPVELAASTDPFVAIPDGKSILLTGASGYLGTALTLHLTTVVGKSIHCLVRDPTRWKHTVQTTYRISDMDWSKVSFIVGDFTKPNFGMTDDQYAHYVDVFDVIIHAGSLVNYSLSYAKLNETNFQGTKSLIPWTRRATLHHISSNGIYPGNWGDCVASDLENLGIELANPNRGTPYGQSKWVLEMALIKSLKRPLAFYRPGNIGPFQSGAYNVNDFQMMILKAALDIETGIKSTPYKFEYTPVDEVIDSMLSVTSPCTINIVNSTKLPLHEIAALKHNLVDLDTWKEKVKHVDPVLVAMLSDVDGWLNDPNKYHSNVGPFEYEPSISAVVSFMKSNSA